MILVIVAIFILFFIIYGLYRWYKIDYKHGRGKTIASFLRGIQRQEGKSLMDTTVLVDSGTYAIVRHPQFLGSILLMSASILISQHWLVAIAGVIMSALFYREQVTQEKTLLVKFGDDYKRYMEKVPRMNFLLGIIRLLRRRGKKEFKKVMK